MAAAARVLVAADGGKWGHVAFARVCPVQAADAVLTDESAPVADRAELAGRGVSVRVC